LGFFTRHRGRAGGVGFNARSRGFGFGGARGSTLGGLATYAILGLELGLELECDGVV